MAKYTSVCDKCREYGVYSPKYDAYYCYKCDIWLENKCKEEDCEFCIKRPEKPSKNIYE